jgi:hypothetical protein
MSLSVIQEEIEVDTVETKDDETTILVEPSVSDCQIKLIVARDDTICDTIRIIFGGEPTTHEASDSLMDGYLVSSLLNASLGAVGIAICTSLVGYKLSNLSDATNENLQIVRAYYDSAIELVIVQYSKVDVAANAAWDACGSSFVRIGDTVGDTFEDVGDTFDGWRNNIEVIDE